jgi:hypothetical protein
MKLYFSDFFHVEESKIEGYGAFNVSLLADLPLFVDPFLIFNSKEPRYQELHAGIVRYLRFLKNEADAGISSKHLVDAWFRFSEVKQNWLGFSVSGNYGRGLGRKFANALNGNLHLLFTDFGSERVTKGTHLEKLCLIADGVGRDMISDFTTNLIKGFLLDYTQTFAREHLSASSRRRVAVRKVCFNYETKTWEHATFDLPWYGDDYVLLTPTNILTRDETWINRRDFENSFDSIPQALPDGELRAQVNAYLLSVLPKKPKEDEQKAAIWEAVRRFPRLLDAYIRLKEDTGDQAVSVSGKRVRDSATLYVEQFRQVAEILALETGFYGIPGNTYEDARQRALFLKDVIENKGGHRFFYVDGQPLERESDLHILFRLTWFATESDVTTEANDGRGPVDFKISRGALDKTLVEFKLAKNSQLRKNLENQTKIYEKASDAKRTIKAIVFFTEAEEARVVSILADLKLLGSHDVVLIDARRDNKPSGSRA